MEGEMEEKPTLSKMAVDLGTFTLWGVYLFIYFERWHFRKHETFHERQKLTLL